MKVYQEKEIVVESLGKISYRQGDIQAGRPQVLLIHGNMSSSVHMEALIESLEGHANVYAPDLPGFGHSDYVYEHDSIEEFAQDLAKIVAALSLEKFDIAAWSAGGLVALELAYLLPNQVKQIYLLGTVGIQGYPMYQKGEDKRPIFGQPLLSKEEIAQDQYQVQSYLDINQTKNFPLLEKIWTRTIYQNKQPDPGTYARHLEATMQQVNLVDLDYALVHYNMTQEATAIAPGSGHISGVDHPIYILHGKLDKIIPYDQALLNKKFFGDQAQLISFDQAGHSLIQDNLADVSQLILENL